MNKNKNQDKIRKILTCLSKKLNKNGRHLFSFLIVVIFFEYFLFPLPAMAEEASADNIGNESPTAIEASDIQIFAGEQSGDLENLAPMANLPENSDLKPRRTKFVEITAYSSDVNQCDSDPCTTANGFNVCQHGVEDTIATNALPFGTLVRIPELFGDRIFVVRDRMNSRYHDRVDVWMINKQDAVKFGITRAKIEILR